MRILTFFICPIVSDVGIIFGTITASAAIVDADPTNIGRSLYPLPPETILISSTNPFAVLDVVLYFKGSHSDCRYDNLSGISVKTILNVVSPIPTIL